MIGFVLNILGFFMTLIILSPMILCGVNLIANISKGISCCIKYVSAIKEDTERGE